MLTDYNKNENLETINDNKNNFENSKILQLLFEKNPKISTIIEKKYNKMVLLETINAILASCIILSAMIEYELGYFKYFYGKKNIYLKLKNTKINQIENKSNLNFLFFFHKYLYF